MDPKNRPQSREKHVTGNGTGTARRGSGLNTGPVGAGSRPQSQRPQGERPGGQRPVAQSGETTRAGRRRSPLGIIILILVLLLGAGGKSLFGDLFGALSGDYGTTGNGSQSSGYSQQSSGYSQQSSGYSQQSGGYNQQSSGYNQPGNSYSDFSSFFSSPSGSSHSNLNQDSSVNTNSNSVNTQVASGARAKRTQIYGRGMDNVTIMVYMCGTDLESRSAMATRDLIEMTKATLGSNVRILVYTGGCTRWNNDVISSSRNQIYEISNGGLKCLVDNAGNSAMTDPETLAGFIQWCGANYPANRNMLILWDHGGGSVSGFGYDQKFTRSGSMTLDGIGKALKKGGVSFDIIGFDACLMATVETALMLDPYADYMIASEETEPGIGWYYSNWLTKLGANTSMDSVQIGKAIVDDFVSTCASQCRGQSATLSVIDLAELSATVPAPMKAFSESISASISSGSYAAVSTARGGTREFARSTAIDQIDLVDFANRLGSSEGKRLAAALRGAVKYNRTSSDMSNAYGLSIYFPYRKLSNVNKAISTYDAIGMDASYAACIREFASLEAGGQAASGGTLSPFDVLFGNSYSSSGGYTSSPGGYTVGSSSYDDMDALNSLLEGFFGGSSTGGLDLGGLAGSFLFGRSMSVEDTARYIAENHFDAGALIWTVNADGERVIALPEEQWEMVESLDLNVFYDDGEGYIDLGLDNVFDFDEEGNLLAPTDRTWLGVNGQTVAYYHDTTSGEGDSLVITGHIPALLNGERSELLVLFDSEHPWGTITGARRVYLDGETDTVAKSLVELEDGDVIDFVCDYYRYDGSYENSYLLGSPLTVNGELELSNVDVGEGAVSICFRFSDIYQQHYWTPALIF